MISGRLKEKLSLLVFVEECNISIIFQIPLLERPRLVMISRRNIENLGNSE